ncbi:FkbM family methyltransferase [uncultured Methanobrevibacter sp.]|uniref:FkbM family methyltransferase n=1 Tax=uncultured Methanobrevibacter sp. TaxID=253161 RepID=UPI00261F1956|nr:FkbM family methyltransferase [uncultured Methanobrevibacter sp.]
MSFQQKILSKSNSYNYYKEKNEVLVKEIEELKKEIKELKEEKEITLKDEFLRQYGINAGFCNWNYINYYFSEDFEDKLKEVTKHLDKKSKNTFKWLLLRALAVNVIKMKSIHFTHELKEQQEFIDFRLKYSAPNEIAGYKYLGRYNVHAFMDSTFTDEDKEFIKNKDIIDAGAYTGDTSIPIAKFTNKNIYAFEPFEESVEILKKNIQSNNIKNIIPVQKSLGNKNGEMTLYLSGDNVQGITSNPHARDYDTELKVEETTLDTFVKENNLDVGYITVDVEGAELELLEGAIETIKSQKPILTISIYHKVTDFFEIIPWIADLDLGYEFEVVKENPWPFLSDTVVKCRAK